MFDVHLLAEDAEVPRGGRMCLGHTPSKRWSGDLNLGPRTSEPTAMLRCPDRERNRQMAQSEGSPDWRQGFQMS